MINFGVRKARQASGRVWSGAVQYSRVRFVGVWKRKARHAVAVSGLERASNRRFGKVLWAPVLSGRGGSGRLVFGKERDSKESGVASSVRVA